MLIALHRTPAPRLPCVPRSQPVTSQPASWPSALGSLSRRSTSGRSVISLQTARTLPIACRPCSAPAQETVVVHLRRTLMLPLDDLLAVTREFICPHVSRSGLDRCLRRHGASNLNALKPQEPAVAHKAFKSYEPGYVHMDVKYLPQMQDESQRRYLFVAIDRATRWVFVQLKPNKTSRQCARLSEGIAQGLPAQDHQLLTDNGQGVHRPTVCQPQARTQRQP